MNARAESIYALASAHGKAGVAVLRISGAKAQAALHLLGVETPAPRVATLATLKHDGRVIDQALVLFFPGPNSFTGEDVIELHTHGSKAVVKLLLDALATFPGLRLAEPGEFARRAFLYDKLDLAQAEGLADLIDAETSAQHAQAVRQMGGESSQRLKALREQILAPLALLEAYIDFPDEEIPEDVLNETSERIKEVQHNLKLLLEDGGIGEKIRDGVEIVILGPPNAGKSSLLNALSRRDVAIVSDEAGTTRDMIEVHLDLAGFAATLVDTAGLREASGAVEAEGIRRARERAETADFRLVLLDAVTAMQQMDEIKPLLGENALLVLTKRDLAGTSNVPLPALSLSTTTGEGMAELIAALTAKVTDRMGDAPSPLITRARHREALEGARRALAGFDLNTQPLELACEELRVAATQVGKITGKIWVDDVLDLVFSRFCIGK